MTARPAQSYRKQADKDEQNLLQAVSRHLQSDNASHTRPRVLKQKLIKNRGQQGRTASLSDCVSVYPSVYLSACLINSLSICPLVYLLSVCQSVYMPVCLCSLLACIVVCLCHCNRTNHAY